MGKGNDPNCDNVKLTGGAGGMDHPFGDLTAMNEVEIDKLWAEKREPLGRAMERRADAARKIRRYQKANHKVPEYLTDQVAAADEAIERERQILAPFDEEWDRRGGWSRAWLCNSHNGHIHRSHGCPSLKPGRTMVSWLPELSGASDDDIIAQAGHTACTKCYPDAPSHPAFIAAEKKAQAEEAKKTAELCPGSGQIGEELQMQFMSPRGRCPVCKRTKSVTSTGKVRRHKP